MTAILEPSGMRLRIETDRNHVADPATSKLTSFADSASHDAPAWTVLFARVAAVVTDTGSPVAHAPLVARERLLQGPQSRHPDTNSSRQAATKKR